MGDLSRLTGRQQLARLLAHAERARRTVERVHDVPSAELRLLWLLSDGRERTLKEISDELALEQSTVNRQVGAAEARGHLSRHRADGAPAQLIARTPAGEEAFARASVIQLRALDAGISAVGDDYDLFFDTLERFVTAYDAAATQIEAGN